MKACFVTLLSLAMTAAPLAVLAQQAFYGSPQGLSAVGQGEDCFPRKIYDRQSHESITLTTARRGCPAGYIKAENLDTGRKWRVDIDGGGVMAGVDEDGARWRYDPRAKLFTNLATGRSCAHSTPRHVCSTGPS
jgi:hypothetical protein